jgi:hypothetical protein
VTSIYTQRFVSSMIGIRAVLWAYRGLVYGRPRTTAFPVDEVQHQGAVLVSSDEMKVEAVGCVCVEAALALRSTGAWLTMLWVWGVGHLLSWIGFRFNAHSRRVVLHLQYTLRGGVNICCFSMALQPFQSPTSPRRSV